MQTRLLHTHGDRIEAMQREVNHSVVTMGCVRVPPPMRVHERRSVTLSL